MLDAIGSALEVVLGRDLPDEVLGDVLLEEALLIARVERDDLGEELMS